ncbi:hypothetical protein E1265_34390 [Streptomyces sp. 8K308]|uniref:hypothetical protein n=1 Tax=Streptomyces sp. 8K308 TaxID=2530388 RepID=UPI0010445E77|nr:hypothetical protein [Streptomyces sp. 8K308]TDC06961.1 hypothetical protein E1265_34390 [Streptomyces sp. 8K308]
MLTPSGHQRLPDAPVELGPQHRALPHRVTPEGASTLGLASTRWTLFVGADADGWRAATTMPVPPHRSTSSLTSTLRPRLPRRRRRPEGRAPRAAARRARPAADRGPL